MMKTMRRMIGSVVLAMFPISALAGIHVQQSDPNLTIGSVTVNGGGGVNVTYGVVAATFTGNGAGLTNISATVSLPLPAGATNYINVTPALQSGATFYVSSGTVDGTFYTNSNVEAAGKSVYLGSSAGTAIQLQSKTSALNSCTINGSVVGGCSNVTPQLIVSTYAAGANAPMLLDAAGRLSVGKQLGPNQLNVTGTAIIGNAGSFPTVGISQFQVQTATTATYAVLVGTAVLGGTTLGISTSSEISLNGSVGSNGQVLTSAGPGAVPAWTTVSAGGGGGYAVAPATVAFNLAQGVTGTTFSYVGPSLSTVTYGLAVGSLTITGTGAGGWQFTEGYDTTTFAPTSTKDNLWASISSHSLVTNYNASTATGTIVVSTFNIGAGHYLTSSALGQIGDGGITSIVAQGSSGNVQYNSAGSLAGSNKFQFNGTSVTVTSSMTVNTGNGANNVPALVDIYDGNSYETHTLFGVGSNLHLSQFIIQDGQPITENFGFAANNVVMGVATYPHSLYDNGAILNQIILSSGNSSGSGVPGEMDLETTSDKGQPIIFLPGLVKTMTVSSETVTISTRTSIVATTNGLYALTVSTTTSNYQLAVTTTGHVSSYGVLPSTSSCGTGAGFTGTDVTGIITPGSGAGGCTVTFARPYKNTPSCIVEEQTLSLVNALSWTVSTTALTITQTSLTSKVNYICTGINE